MDALYSNQILALAANMPRVGRLAEPDGTAKAVSKVCGSEVEVDLRLDGTVISDLAVRPKACALGQAATAVLAANAVGASLAELEAARDGLAAMLKEGAPPPQGRFADLAALAPVKDYPRRWASVQLAFRAALDAAASVTTAAGLHASQRS
ncbi:MAG: iron-sulfur cluster assembly scaffold protein [Maricaulaceae bacterium]